MSVIPEGFCGFQEWEEAQSLGPAGAMPGERCFAGPTVVIVAIGSPVGTIGGNSQDEPKTTG